MRNFKLENNLVGEVNWPKFASVFLSGNRKALHLDVLKSQEYNDAVVESWEKVAVLRVLAPEKTKFHLGFATKKSVQYSNPEFETDLKFAVRLGPSDINFFVFPENIKDKILLEVVEITTDKDEKYKDLILI